MAGHRGRLLRDRPGSRPVDGRGLGADVAERIDWVEGDLATWTPQPGHYDLVACLYVHVAGSVEEMVRRMAAGVAPGGTLLLVGHRPIDPATGAADGRGRSGAGLRRSAVAALDPGPLGGHRRRGPSARDGRHRGRRRDLRAKPPLKSRRRYSLVLPQPCPESHGMPDAIFEDQRLVSIYDALDSDRRDLDVYAAMIDEFRPKTVIDLGCGTGLLARRLARSGIAVTGVDPAAGSLEYARAQPGARRVRWILGDASALTTAAADLVS